MSIERVLPVLCLVVALAWGSEGHAQQCRFPEAVPLIPGENATAALGKLLSETCPTPAVYRPWAGVPVTGADGIVVGKTGELLVGDLAGQKKVFLEVIRASGPPFAVDMTYANISQRYSDNHLALRESDVLASYVAGDTLLSDGVEVPVLAWNDLGSGEIAALMVAGSANPYPDFMIVSFESDPSDALVRVGKVSIGPTTTRAWVARGSLDQIALELEGYAPCGYHDGRFVEPTVTDDAHFYCLLRK